MIKRLFKEKFHGFKLFVSHGLSYRLCRLFRTLSQLISSLLGGSDSFHTKL